MTIAPQHATVESELRAAVDRWLADPGEPTDPVDPGRRYLAGLAATGWSTPTWPERYGGRDSGPAEHTASLQLRDELEHPDLYAFMIGLAIAGPTLLVHGTDDQRERWLRRISDGTEVWCQMFSEPEAGSDLANVHTAAERTVDGWVLRGQKVWTSRAMYADRALCLVRTDPHQPKHRGLTMVALDMRGPGLTVRPLVQMNRDAHFSEVHIDDYVVPDADVVGDVGHGWSIAMTMLGFERGISNERVGPPRVASAPGWLVELAASGALEHGARRDRAMRAAVLDLVARLTALRATISSERGRSGPEGSGAKLRNVAAYKAMAGILAEGAGADALLDGSELAKTVLTAPSMSIRGGTDEIQRNILAERVLGLPGDIRLDRDVPWTESARGVLRQ